MQAQLYWPVAIASGYNAYGIASDARLEPHCSRQKISLKLNSIEMIINSSPRDDLNDFGNLAGSKRSKLQDARSLAVCHKIHARLFDKKKIVEQMMEERRK